MSSFQARHFAAWHFRGVWPTPLEGYLFATDLVADPPVIDAPSLGQVHALAAADLRVASVVIEAPSLGGVPIALVADDLVVAPLLFEAPAGGVCSVLSATDLVVDAPLLDAPVIAQGHVLLAPGLVLAAVIIDAASPIQVELVAADLRTGGLDIGHPWFAPPPQPLARLMGRAGTGRSVAGRESRLAITGTDT